MDRSKSIVRISAIGILVNVILVVFKMAVGLFTNSIAIILDAVNNLSDALSSVITIVGTKLAGKAPDKKHPYGYGRIEYITSITIALLILITGLTSLRESADKILHPQPASYTAGAILIIAVAVLVKFFLGRYVKAAGLKYSSESLIASGTEGIFDSAISLSTLLAAGVSMWWHVSIEGILGAAISLLILRSGVETLLSSLSGIIGARVDGTLSKELKQYIRKYPYVLGAYDLVLHRYGPERIIGSVHVELSDEITARQIHRLSHRIAHDVKRDYGIVLTVGIYASNTATEASAEMRAQLLELISAYPEVLGMHGFYMDEEYHVVSFDIVIDFKALRSTNARQELIDAMQRLYPAYRFTIAVDSDYSD